MAESYMDEPEKLVAEFQEKFDTSEDQNLWVNLIIEESKEINQAIADLIKELSDFMYVTMGYKNIGGTPDALMDNTDVKTAIQWLEGLAPLIGGDRLDTAFKRVHESNLSKLGEDGKPIRRADGKILKGPNYKPPVLLDLVRL